MTIPVTLPVQQGETMKTLTAAEIQALIRKATTLEQSHALTVLLVKTLEAKYQGTKYQIYVKGDKQ